MNKEIVYNEGKKKFRITIDLDKYQTMQATYGNEGDPPYTVDNLCVYINKKYSEYSLSHLIYLDYKDSYQAGQSIIFFDTQKEAEKVAELMGLQVHYYHGV
jgi:hypothetical protein